MLSSPHSLLPLGRLGTRIQVDYQLLTLRSQCMYADVI